jgi:hypothetical protein
MIVGAAGAAGAIAVTSSFSTVALDAASSSIAYSRVAPPFIAISIALLSFSASASIAVSSIFLPRAVLTFAAIICLSSSSSLSKSSITSSDGLPIANRVALALGLSLSAANC